MVYEMFTPAKNPSAQFIGFASDNYAPAHQKVLEYLQKANHDYARPYNDDLWTLKFTEVANDLFDKEVAVFPSLNGTGTNVLCLRALLPRWGTVCSAETAHINTDEAGAPEHMAGLKIMTAPTTDGKIVPDDIDNIAKALGDIHSAQPAIVSISNTTERGTFYSADEIGDLAQTAHKNGMLIHVDGARIFNAIVSAGYQSTFEGFKEMYADTQVDVISLGGTKVGAMSAESVVVLHPKTSPLVHGAKFSQKQMGQLGSKARYSSAQFLALFEDDLAFKLAKHANETTNLLFEKYLQITNAKKADKEFLSGATSAYASGESSQNYQNDFSSDFYYQCKPDANAFFPTMPNHIINKLREAYHFYNIDQKADATTIRLMTSWATTLNEIDDFAKTLDKIVN